MRGPNRTILAPTAAGREALMRGSAEPVDHVRDVRSLLLLKLVFADRLDVDARPMLEAQHDANAASVAALEERIGALARHRADPAALPPRVDACACCASSRACCAGRERCPAEAAI